MTFRRHPGAVFLVVLCASLPLWSGQQTPAPELLYTPTRVGTIPYRWSNGNAWLSLDSGAKVAYLVGLQEGIVLGVRESWQGLPAKSREEILRVAGNITVAGVTFGDLSEQIDAVYTDVQNLPIPIADVYLYASRKLKGEPEARLKEDLATLRKTYTTAPAPH
jgi:hypothetical protein